MTVAVPLEGGKEQRGKHPRPARHLPARERLAEEGPGHQRAEERGHGEQHLRSGGPELLGPGDVENQRQSVPDRADEQGAGHRAGGQFGRPEGQAEDDVEPTRDQPFHEGGLGRREAVDGRRQVVVDGPAEAGRGDQQGGNPGLEPGRGREDRPRHQDDGGRRPGAPTDVLVERRPGEQGRRHRFHVQPQRHGGGRGLRQARHQQHRGEDAPGDHGPCQAKDVPPVQGCGAIPDRGRKHGQRRAQVEQPGKQDRRERAQQGLRGRGRGPEEDRRNDAAHQGPGRGPRHVGLTGIVPARRTTSR